MKIKALVTEFANRLKELVETDAMERARRSVLQAFGIDAPGKPGRPSKAAATSMLVAKKTRKKPPRQLCPVPGCKNSAAPIFGMVCKKHKDVPKAKIKKYREARKATKLGLKSPTRKMRTAKTAARRPAARKIVRRTVNGTGQTVTMSKPGAAPQPAATTN